MVLVVTFGGISLSTVRTIERLNQWIRITHEGYLQLSLLSVDLDSRETTLRRYLREDLGEQTSERWARKRLQRLLDQRQNLVTKTETILEDMRPIVNNGSMHEVVRAHFFETEELVTSMRQLLDESEPNYQKLLAHPPIERGADAVQTLAQAEILKVRTRQMRLELQISQRSTQFRMRVISMVQRLSERLDVLSRRIWIYTLVFSGLALVLGVLMTIAARVMLRPLKQLGDAAGRIASGDYAHRIDVQGPKEIAELAHEFNVMGKAIEDRSIELVRTERLATAGKMAAMITHEVRNPLSSIALNTELLEEELSALPKDRAIEAQELCRSITKEVDRLTDITEEYLQLARFPTPKLQEESLERIVGSVVDFVRDQLKTRGVQIEVDLHESPRLSLDEGQIRQAMLNLIRNAADAVEGQEKAIVMVSVRANETHVALGVCDNGPGIPDAMMPRLFEAFVSDKTSGTGLGLALTQQIFSDHGATIDVSNADSGGAEFWIRFPIDTASPRS